MILARNLNSRQEPTHAEACSHPIPSNALHASPTRLMNALPNPESRDSEPRSARTDSGPLPIVPAKRGRSRDQQSRAAIHAATRQLAKFSSRYREVSIEKIAAEANASKATIYRWWDSKADLIRDACLLDPFTIPAENSLDANLRHLAEQWTQLYSQAMTRPVLAGTWADSVEANSQRARNGEPIQECPHMRESEALLEKVFRQAVSQGQWQGPYQVKAALAILQGQVFLRVVGEGQGFAEAEYDRLVEHALLAARP